MSTAAFALWLTATLGAATWFWPAARTDALTVTAVVATTASASLAFSLRIDGPAPSELLAHALLGALHLAALAILARRIPGSPSTQLAVFLSGPLLLPALIPALGPFLDASPSFHPGQFPRWNQVVPSILTLAVISHLLPIYPSAPGATAE